MSTAGTFDPARRLTKLNGAEYLEVKWRLVWLRDRCPDAQVITDLIEHDAAAGRALFRCRVSLPSGGSATGWAQEEIGDFRDYLEKAETKAIGRALAALGFGTQFSREHIFGAEHGRVVDAPVQVITTSGNPEAASPQQLRYLHHVAREHGLEHEELQNRCMLEFDVPCEQLSRRDCSTMIDLLSARAATR